MRDAPLVYASKSAQEDAAELFGPCVVVERIVQHAISDGRFRPKSCAQELGVVFTVDIDDTVIARCKRIEGRSRPMPWAWSVVGVERKSSNTGG
jgi:hypothetical protein